MRNKNYDISILLDELDEKHKLRIDNKNIIDIYFILNTNDLKNLNSWHGVKYKCGKGKINNKFNKFVISTNNNIEVGYALSKILDQIQYIDLSRYFEIIIPYINISNLMIKDVCIVFKGDTTNLNTANFSFIENGLD